MTSQYNVWKVDRDWNILINYNPGTSAFRVISNNPSNVFINVVVFFFYEIQFRILVLEILFEYTFFLFFLNLFKLRCLRHKHIHKV